MMDFSSAREIPSFAEAIDGYWREIQSRQSGEFSGAPFKFPTLNNYLTIEPGELVIFGAEAKHGKSMMLLNCACDLLKNDHAVLYIDSELNSRLFTARMLSHLTSIEFRRIRNGDYSQEEANRIGEAIEFLKTRRFTHLYMPIFDQQSVYTAVKKVKHTQGLDTLIVDYFKSSGQGDAFAGYNELGRFVDMVKNQVCGDLGISASAQHSLPLPCVWRIPPRSPATPAPSSISSTRHRRKSRRMAKHAATASSSSPSIATARRWSPANIST